MADKARAHAGIAGTVQGVGFRWFVRRSAERRGITGWVRNRSDGSVELEAEGERAAVEEFLREVRNGPPFSRVTSVTVHWIPPRHDSSFEVTG